MSGSRESLGRVRAFEEKLIRALDGAGPSGQDSGLSAAVLRRIAARTPREAERDAALQQLRGMSLGAAVLLAALLVASFGLPAGGGRGPGDVAGGSSAPFLLPVEEDGSTTMATEVAILHEVLLGGVE